MVGIFADDAEDVQMRYERELGMRVKLLTSTSPWLGKNPDLVRQMALDGRVDTQTLAMRSASVAGMMDMDALNSRMKTLPSATQRAMYAQLTPSQQDAIGQLGYSTPERTDTGPSGLFGLIGDVTGSTIHALSSAVKTVAAPILEGMNTIGNVPTSAYRTIRSLDVSDQITSFLAGGIAAAGVVLAIPTGGLSLGATATVAGLAGLGAANAAGFITAGSDWVDAAQHSWNGEHLFSASSQHQASQLLRGNATIMNLARDMAYDGGIDEMAEDFAGIRDSTTGNAVIGSVERIVRNMVDPSDPRYDSLVAKVSQLAENDDFREAVSTLQNGKISFGRDIAGLVGLDEGDRWFDVMSGAADALFVVTLDPLLAAGAANKAWKLSRYAIPESDATTAAQWVGNLITNNKSVRRSHEVIADAINTGDFAKAKRFMPESQTMWDDLIKYRDMRRGNGEAVFDIDSMKDWYTEGGGLTGLLQGKGTVKGQSQIMLANSTAPGIQWSKFKAWGNQTINFADSNSSVKAMKHIIDQSNDEQMLLHISQEAALPEARLARSGLDFNYAYSVEGMERYKNTKAILEWVDKAPIFGSIERQAGALLGTFTRMIPHGGFITLEGGDAAMQIDKFMDLGRTVGMKSSTIDAWKAFTLNQNNPALRRIAMQSYLETMLRVGGAELTPGGRELMQQFVSKQHNVFGLGGLDELVVGGIKQSGGILPVADQAGGLAMPNLKVLRQAAQKGAMMKYLFNAGDVEVLENFTTRIWKPAVLIRLGFIPRAAGEELLSFFAREGVSKYLATFGERSIAQGNVARNPELYGKVDAAMAEQIKHWKAVAHVRPLERILSRYNAPTTMLEKYSSWLRDGLEDGILSKQFVEAIPESVKTAVLGKDRSLRRLVLSGIDPDVDQAAAAFYTVHGSSIARKTSAAHAGILDPGQPEKIIRVPGVDEHGNPIDVPMVLMHDQYAYLEQGDEYYANGVHQSMTHVMSDPVVAGALAPTLARVLPSGLKAKRVEQLWSRYKQINDTSIQALVDMALSGKSLSTRFSEAWLKRFESHFDPSDVELLRAWMPGQGATGEQIIDSLVQSGVFKTARDQNNLARARDVLADLKTMNPDQRGWAQLHLTHRPDIPYVADNTPKLRWTDQDQLEYEDLVHRGSNQFSTPYSQRDAPPPPGGFNEPLTAREQRVVDANTRRSARTRELEAKREAVAAQQYGQYTQNFWLNPRQANEQMLDSLRGIQLDPANQEALRQSLHNIRDASGTPVAKPLNFKRVYNPQMHSDNASRLTEGMRSDPRIRELRASGLGVQDTIRQAMKERLESLPRRQWRDPRATELAHQWIDEFTERFFPEKGNYLDEYVRDAIAGVPDRVVFVGGTSLTDPRVASDITEMLQTYVSPRATRAARNNGSGVSYLDVNFDEAANRYISEPLLANGKSKIVPSNPTYHDVGKGQWVHGTTVEDSVKSWSDVIMERVNQVAREDVRSVMVPRNLDEVYRKEGDKFVAMMDDEPVLREATQSYYRYDEKKRKFYELKRGDTKYFTTREVTHGDGWLFDQVGPALRDTLDEATGKALFDANGERMFHYTVEDVGRSTGHLPRHVFAPQMRPPAELTKFERATQFSFNKVISPSIDAIVRRPMAFHQFVEAHRSATRASRWFLDTDLFDGTIPKVFSNSWGKRAVGLHDRQRITSEARDLNAFFDHDITGLSQSEVMGYLHSLGTAELEKVRSRVYAAGQGYQPQRAAITHLLRTDRQAFRFGVDGIDAHVEFVRSLLDEIPPNVLRKSWDQAQLTETMSDFAVNNRALYDDLDESSWTALQRASNNLKWQSEQIVESATLRGLTNTVPFLDSHEFKSQFAEYGRAMMPFWYAEENFAKRWARTLAMNPEAIRKGQLTYMAMKNVGIVRTDSQGNDWFIYPGSEALTAALSNVPGLGALPIGAAFQTQTTQLLPGFNEQVGTPSFSPFVTIPVSTVSALLPETKPMFKAFLGPYNSNRGVVEQVIPAQVRNFWDAFTQDDGDAKYASAMMAAAGIMEANGKGLPEDATTDQINDYMDTLRTHARTVLIARAITGFVSPGAPSEIDTQDTGLLGIGSQDKARLLREEYLTLIRQQGIDEGTVAYLKNHDEASPSHLINPLAYSVGQSVSSSGAPLPATREAVAFYADNTDWLQDMPNAGPWLLPPDQTAGSAISQDAYTQQTIDGLRERRTPDEFIRAIRFKAGATEYFRMRDSYQSALAEAHAAGDNVWRQQIENQWDLWSGTYQSTHPVFAEELVSGAGRTRRAKVLDELRIAVNDPEGPRPWHFDRVRTVVNTFTQYQAAIAQLSVSRDAESQAEANDLKQRYAEWMGRYVVKYPEIEPLWTSVIKPEAALD